MMSGLAAWRFAFSAAPSRGLLGARSARFHGAAGRLRQQQQQQRRPPPGGAGSVKQRLYNDPNYIPQRPAKNPMKSVGWAWLIGMPVGVTLFILAKGQVERNRAKQLSARRRMQLANVEDAETRP
ncbi:uncharacterized protein LOC116954661 [Petromyzon marinus]|uniref:Uncharacterized protein LOC116954661 n=1 Tax=Petromyzon marinus TaxID=7757 RepID=A0AAJ7U7N8_PETMA|nr:uncharacterized protein LOC116954661 [Petromyzon marinus]